MVVRTTLSPLPGGTEIPIDHDELLPGVAPTDNETGTAMGLSKLAGPRPPMRNTGTSPTRAGKGRSHR